MRRAIHRHTPETWPVSEAIATLTLPFEDRERRRVRLEDDAGEAFLLDLPKAVLLGDGDGLELDQGGWIAVRAAPERVIEIPTTSPSEAARLAWHIGNRHTPIQVLEDGTLRILWDHVLFHMLEGLDATPREATAPFAPEPGAYAIGGGHGHAH